MSPRVSSETGRVLGGRYRLVAPVGVGTSSRVFLAVDTQLRRRVAVKLLHEALADDERFLRRFRAEARIAATLNQENSLAVYDWGEDEVDGIAVPYLVTEYLAGGSLRGILDQGQPLSAAQTVRVGIDAARALAHAHDKGLVHRDVKPANLLFDEDGRLRLADFGLARALAEASWTEPLGIAAGSARYLYPEQGSGRRPDGRADVYSLALVLAECMTGTVPLCGDTSTATLAIRGQADVELGPEFGVLRPILERAGRRDPDERPSAAEFERLLVAAAIDLDAPAPLPLVPTLGAAEQTSELLTVDGLGDLVPIPQVIDPPPPTVVDPGEPTLTVAPLDPTWRSADQPPTAEPLTAEPPTEVELLAASRPTSFGPVEPLVGDPAPRRRRRRGPLAVLVVLALVAAAAAGWWFVVRVPTNPVPDFVGTDLTGATAEAGELGWEVSSTETRRDGTRAGQVLEQDPPPGTALAEGESVRLTVSLGPTLAVVPVTAGEPEEAARAALTAAGFVVGEVRRTFDEEVPTGSVIGAEAPDPSTRLDDQGRLPKETVLDLVVSDGPAPRVVPEGLQGARAEDAVAALEALQLVAARNESFSEDVPAGFVVSVSEVPGTELARGTEVVLEVSKGPAPIAVPDVRFNSGSFAAQLLEEAGFTVAGIEGSPSGMVLATDPPPGELHQRGTAVRLFTRN